MVHRLNQVAPFEYGAHLLMTIVLLFTMNFLETILNLPLVAYNVWLYVAFSLRQKPIEAVFPVFLKTVTVARISS